MHYQTMAFEKRGHVTYVVLNGAQTANAIDDEMAAEFRDACRVIAEDDDTRVAVVSGSGASFSTGSKLRVLPQAGLASLLERHRVAEAVGKLEKPVIASINGDALGQGLEVALACDIRIGADSAKLALDQITYGQLPWDGGTQRLPRIIPKSAALEMVLTGRIIDAQEAFRLCLLNMVVPAAQLTQKVDELAQKLGNFAPIAARYAKEAVNRGLDMTLEHGGRLEADLAILMHTTEDRVEGISAFLKRRTPQFKGK